MFGEGFFSSHPFFPRLLDDSPWQRRIEEDVENHMMDSLEPWADTDLLLGPRAWVRPRLRWCPYTCMASRPRQPSRRHFLILPRLASDDDAMSSSGRQCRRGAAAKSPKTKGRASATENSSLPNRKHEGCTCNESSERFTSRSRHTSASSVSNEDGSSRVQATSGGRSSNENNSSNSTAAAGVVNARGDAPWQFSADMSGCDEVRAMTEGDMLMVEGRGSNDSSHRMMRYITSLPRHVSHDSLTARLSNGRLTVTQKPGTQHLEGQAKPLHIEMQQQQQKTCEVKERLEHQDSHRSTEKQQKHPESTEQQETTRGNKEQKTQEVDKKQTHNLSVGVEDEQSCPATVA